jgi:hypothetical protein
VNDEALGAGAPNKKNNHDNPGHLTKVHGLISVGTFRKYGLTGPRHRDLPSFPGRCSKLFYTDSRTSGVFHVIE